ncbi:hypothetical protein [Brachybacterium alimentarium]
MAYLPRDLAVLGTDVLVEYLGQRLPATVLATGRTPAFDPQDTRMKS